jgi:hypothetical protein
MEPQTVIEYFSSSLNHQITQWTIALFVASWLHSGRVKKEIKLQMSNLVNVIDGLGLALREDLKIQSQRIEKVEKSLENMDGRVKHIEGGQDDHRN